METVNERLKNFLTTFHIKNEDLRKILLIKQKTQISSWLNDKEAIPDKHILKILREYPNLNANWFLNGSGSMLNDEKSETENKESRIVANEYSLKTMETLNDIIKNLMMLIDKLNEENNKLKEENELMRKEHYALEKMTK